MDLNSQSFMDMLKGKEQVIQSIMKDFDTCSKNHEAFQKLEALYEKGEAVNINQAMKACAKSLRHTNDLNRRMLMLLLVYVSGRNYDSDVATVLSKMGRGEDALKEMFRKKMEGG